MSILRPDAVQYRIVPEQTPQLYQELIEQSPDPIITLDVAGTIRFVNAAAETVSMLQAAELVGKHFTKTGLLPVSGVVKAVQEFALVVAGQTRPPFELEIVRKDQSLLRLEAHPKRLQLIDGVTIQVVFRVTRREDRILELQREVNALLASLNRPPKYSL